MTALLMDHEKKGRENIIRDKIKFMYMKKIDLS